MPIDANKNIARIMGIADKVQDKAIRKAERELILIYKRGLDNMRLDMAVMYGSYGPDLTYSEILKYNRLDKFEKKIVATVKGVNKEANKVITGAIKESYQENYFIHGYSIADSVNFTITLSFLSPDDIRAALLNPFDRVTWPSRLAGHTQDLNNRLKQNVVDALLKGEGVDKAARNLRKEDWFKNALNGAKESWNKAATKSKSIVWTETHRATEAGHSQAWSDAKNSADKLDIEMLKIWDATLDQKTRNSHQDMDGELSDNEGYFTINGKKVDSPGNTGIAEEDINCRCTSRAHFPDMPVEYRLDNETKELRPWTNYREWAEERGYTTKREYKI